MTPLIKQMSKEEIIGHLNKIMLGMSKDRLIILLNQLKGNPSKWKRKYPRKACIISVDFDTLDYSNKKIIRNLSVDGAYIEAEESFIVGQEIILWFSISNDENLSIKIPAKVVRRDPKGIGVKFQKISKQEQKILKQFEIHDNT